MEKYVLALDQGTTSSRAIVFDISGNIKSVAQQEFRQIFPRPGWVEHDPLDIWESQYESAVKSLEQAKIHPSQIAAIGITNQRETTLLWDRKTGKPIHNAIVWQCRRTAPICEELVNSGKAEIIQQKTGLVPDAYFSGTKIKWLLDNVKGLRERAEQGKICFGTVDSWLLFKLTGEHATEPSNASRTMLFNIHEGKWDSELLDMLDIPDAILPEVKPSNALFGHTKTKLFDASIPVCGILGDQQAALFGQGCFAPGSMKITYGTGCFALLNTGKTPVDSSNKLLTTIAWDLGDGPVYALEGSVFIGGAVVQWLRDELKIVKTAHEADELAEMVPGSDGVVFVPAFVGLGAPYWDSEVRGTIFGITRGAGKAHIARAALESIAYQCNDLVTGLRNDTGKKIKSLKVDGGASKSEFLMQFQSDILNIPLERPTVGETTALGAAYCAGLSAGFWKSLDELKSHLSISRTFTPAISASKRREQLNLWQKAVSAARNFQPN
jgi:glycerol kinase